MSVPHQSRASWTRRPNHADEQPSKRRGVAVHWPGFRFTLGRHGDCLGLVARLEREAVDRGGYAALPYNEAVCPHGYRIEGRGADRRSGANGSRAANTGYGSVVALLPIGARPSQEMLRGLHASLAAQAPGGRLVSHRAVRPESTACPGPALIAWLNRGAPRPAEDKPPRPKRAHRVARGETLWDLARHYYGNGAKWTKIARANDLKDADELTVGDRLIIP